jgi:AraC-like DNA-binding protein/quercetin dioxygenase-like cupin family protein
MPRTPAEAPPPARRARVGPVTPHLFAPTRERPLRAKRHFLAASSEVVPHRHPWAQVAISARGVVRLRTPDGTVVAPATRAVWIPPDVEHAVTVLEDTELRTLYLHQRPGRPGPAAPRDEAGRWQQCRVLEVSPLLRACVLAMDTTPDGHGAAPADLAREQRLAAVACDELRRAPALPIGIPLPQDKRLRALCEAILDAPARHGTLDSAAAHAGASARTLARLFRDELGTTFGQWRQQVLLARALAFAAQGRSMAWIAAELGYASASAFGAMVKKAVGQPPRRFFAREA